MLFWRWPTLRPRTCFPERRRPIPTASSCWCRPPSSGRIARPSDPPPHPARLFAGNKWPSGIRRPTRRRSMDKVRAVGVGASSSPSRPTRSAPRRRLGEPALREVLLRLRGLVDRHNTARCAFAVEAPTARRCPRVLLRRKAVLLSLTSSAADAKVPRRDGASNATTAFDELVCTTDGDRRASLGAGRPAACSIVHRRKNVRTGVGSSTVASSATRRRTSCAPNVDAAPSSSAATTIPKRCFMRSHGGGSTLAGDRPEPPRDRVRGVDKGPRVWEGKSL